MILLISVIYIDDNSRILGEGAILIPGIPLLLFIILVFIPITCYGN